MRKSLRVFGRIAAVIILGVLPTTGCPAPGGKLLPLANERVRVVFHEDTEMTGEASQDDITVAASGIWSPGGTDVVIDVNNKSSQPVRVDFKLVKLTNGEGIPATLVRVVEYVQRDGRQQTQFLYDREKAEAEAVVVLIAPGSQRRLQAGFRYQSEDSPGGKLGDKATLEVSVQNSQGKQPGNFDFAFEYKGK